MTELRAPRNEETLRRCRATAYGPEAWPDLSDIVAPARAAELPLLTAMLREAPHRPPAVPRSLHAAGAVAAAALEREGSSARLGALLRLSVSARPLPGPDRPFIIGAAFRLDDDPRADLVTACPFTGVDTPWPLAGPTSNRLAPPPKTYGPARTVEDVLTEQADRSLREAGMGGSALFVPARRFLRHLGGGPVARFVPDPHLQISPEPEEDFRHALGRLAPSTRLGTLEVGPEARWRVRTTSAFVASRHGDHQLLFRHDFDGPEPASGCPFHEAGSAGGT
jgi:hypothetical protein